MSKCPCGAGPTNGPAPAWSAAWHRWHQAHHLATFPDVDQITRDNLATFTAIAERREGR